MTIIRTLDNYVAQKLSNKLIRFVGQKLSACEWINEVAKAYQEFLKDMDPTMSIGATLITTACPLEKILSAAIWAIPRE